MENLINTKIRILNADHSKAFQEHVFSKGGKWRCGSSKTKHLIGPYLYINNEGSIGFNGDEEYFVDSPYREITFDLLDAWDGSGFPPTGTVCVYLRADGDEWRKCVVVAYYFANMVAVDVLDSAVVLMQPMMFRPIKTPEQIAEEKRQQAIDGMMCLALRVGSEYRDVMGMLYDAGYRKTEVKK